MSFVLYVSGLILIGSVAWLVAAPLFRPRRDMPPSIESEYSRNLQNSIDRWERQKKEAYAAIKEAEFDRQTGKLTQEDYDFLREKYEARALEAMAQLDQPQQKEAGQEETQATVPEQQPVLPSES
jgi:hypothetical protein